MKIILTESLHLKFGVVFPKDVELETTEISGTTCIQHPTRESVITQLPTNKKKYKIIEN